MKPRVFISSTYYDLKYVREKLEKFIENYEFEPVLFESGDVTFEHNTKLDVSCYKEVNLCHIMILIVGGRYGYEATGINKEKIIDKYEEEYISITRSEYETAKKNNIPVFIFIDKNVFAEYQTFKENKDFFEKQSKIKVEKADDKNTMFKFAHVDSINIFKFIESLVEKPVKSFEKIEDIENYLKGQFAGMFYLYLESLKKIKNEEKVLDSVNELNNTAQRINELLKEVGKKVISDEQEYKKIEFEQLKMLLNYFAEYIISHISFKDYYFDLKTEIYNKIANCIFDFYLDNDALKDAKQNTNDEMLIKYILQSLNSEIEKIIPNIIITGINHKEIYSNYANKVHPLIKDDESIKSEFKSMLGKCLLEKLEFPF